MALIYAFTHTFASYALFGGLFMYLAYLFCTKILGYRCVGVRVKLMWFTLLIPFITFMSLKVLFPKISTYQETLIAGTFIHTLFKWACQVGYWTSLVLTPLIFVWGAIIVIRLFYAVLSGHKFRQLHKPVDDSHFPELFEIIDRFCAGLNIKPPEVYVLSDGWTDCFTFGLIRPALVVDKSMLEWDRNNVKAIIAHELAHIYRKDALLSVVVAFLRDLMFFNPAAHWGYNGIIAAKEEMADEIAVRLTGNRLQYGYTLIKVWKRINEAVGFADSSSVFSALGIAQGDLALRVERVINPKPNRSIPVSSLLLLGVLVTGLLSFIC